jgi:hypothetical protein
MTISLSRRELADSLSHGTIDRDFLDEHPALAGLRLDRGLDPHDGTIDTDAERDRLIAELDRLDGRGDGSITVVDRRGEITAAAEPLRALAEATGAAGLRADLVDAMRQARLNPGILFVGMQDDSARREIAALRRDAPVVAITDVRGSDQVMLGDESLDFRWPGSIAYFARHLGLDAAATRRVEAVITNAQPGARREIAELARALAPAERGEPIAPRLVISGHGNGEAFFGHGDDDLLDRDVVALARAMPRAARQIEHLHLAACQHGWEPRMAAFADAFPRLESIWGYTGFSPSGPTAIAHQRAWERATHDGEAQDLRREGAAGTRRAGEVAIWTRERGFEGLRGRELAVVDRDVQAMRPMVEACLRGDRALRGSTDPELVRAYGLVQEALNNPDFDEQSAVYRAGMRDLRDQILRLRFYASDVAPQFAREYETEITRGYRAAGLDVPDFARLPRDQAMAAIQRLEDAGSRSAEARRALELLQHGLRDLNRELVPTRWL